MYRPTVRYHDVFRNYVDELFQATHLDRNQIIRGALFAAAHSKEFRYLLEAHKKKDVSLPSPNWDLNDGRYWLEQCPKIEERGKDVNVKHRGTNETSEDSRNHFGGQSKGGSEPSRRFESVTRREREVPSERIRVKNKGGISFTFN